jgi:hypothetical protein
VRPSPRGAALNPDFAGPRAMGSAVVDLLTLSPGPSDSDPYVVIARCTNGPCVPILRKCFPLDLTALRDAVDSDGPATRGALFDDIFTQLHQSGALVSSDAPDQEVLVRMVTTTLTCDQIAERPLRSCQWPVEDPSTKMGRSDLRLRLRRSLPPRFSARRSVPRPAHARPGDVRAASGSVRRRFRSTTIRRAARLLK